MADSLSALIRDTLQYLKDPLQIKQPLLASAEECAFFSKNTKKVEMQPSSKTPVPQEQKLPPSPPVAPSSSPIKQILQKTVPSMKIVEHVPDDSEAKRIAEGWKERVSDAEVVLVVCETNSETVEFLKGLAKAIDQNLAKTKILAAERLEKEKRWDLFLNSNAFRLIITSEGMQKLPELMRFYKPNGSQLFLDKIPLLNLSSASVYKSLEHKAQLWKTLCQILKK